MHAAVPPAPDPFVDLLPAAAVHLTPRHYSYLKISEGCNHKCRFCIIPDMRGRLVSRPAHAVLREAERLVAAGVRELLVISQDTSRLRHRPPPRRPRLARPPGPQPHHRPRPRARLARRLGPPALRLPLPARPRPDPADGRRPDPALPRHPLPALATPTCCAAWPARPPRARTLDEIARWRAVCPDLDPALDLHRRLPRRDRGRVRPPARLARRGPARPRRRLPATRTSPAPAPTPCPTTCPRRSSRSAGSASWPRPARSAPRSSPPGSAPAPQVIVDAVDAEGATCRTRGDAPEIDGNLFIDEDFAAPRAPATSSPSRSRRPPTTTSGAASSDRLPRDAARAGLPPGSRIDESCSRRASAGLGRCRPASLVIPSIAEAARLMTSGRRSSTPAHGRRAWRVVGRALPEDDAPFDWARASQERCPPAPACRQLRACS